MTSANTGTNSTGWYVPVMTGVSGPSGTTGDIGQIQVTEASSGSDAGIVTLQDLGECSPILAAGTAYTLTANYQSTAAPVFFDVFIRSDTGSWTYWTDDSATPFAATTGTTWGTASWTLPQALPAGYDGISFGLSVGAPTTLSGGRLLHDWLIDLIRRLLRRFGGATARRMTDSPPARARFSPERMRGEVAHWRRTPHLTHFRGRWRMKMLPLTEARERLVSSANKFPRLWLCLLAAAGISLWPGASPVQASGTGATMTLSLSPPTITADGTSTTTATVTVDDVSGQASPGTPSISRPPTLARRSALTLRRTMATAPTPRRSLAPPPREPRRSPRPIRLQACLPQLRP